MEGAETIELTAGAGAGQLRWSHQDGTYKSANLAIPSTWLTNPEQAERVKEAVRHFATSVRFASKR